jgi:hypothetical protein
LGVVAEQGLQGFATTGRFSLDLAERLCCSCGQVTLAAFALDVVVNGLPNGVGQ